MYRATIIRLAIVLCFCAGYAACGQKGDLYMPEQAEAEQAETASK